jgi:transposase
MTRGATKACKIVLSKDERDYLERLVRRRKVSRGEAQRAEIVLRAADGLNNRAISDAVGVARDTVRLWRERFAKHRLDGLDDEPRCGAPRKIGDDRIEEIITMTLETKPADATHWSTRGMAKASGVSTSSVQRIWRAFCLQPHRAETFKLSTDPQFVEKVRDIVGLYLDPPEKALVICVDEKSQISSARPHPAVAADASRASGAAHS